MADANLVSTLADVGLSENQARVYLASLSLGPAAPTAIAQEAEIKRTTVYPVLESLIQLGLVRVQVKGFKKLYFAENPEKLDSLMEMKHRQLKRTLGELSALHNLKSGESSIEYYEGLKAIKSIYTGLLHEVEPGDDYLIYSGVQEYQELDADFFVKFMMQRAKLPIDIKCIILDGPVAQDCKKNEKLYHLKTKILPRDVMFATNIVIIPKKVVLHQVAPPAWATVIKNKNIVEAQRQLFYSFWHSLPEG